MWIDDDAPNQLDDCLLSLGIIVDLSLHQFDDEYLKTSETVSPNSTS
jgi:hypothetical protein